MAQWVSPFTSAACSSPTPPSCRPVSGVLTRAWVTLGCWIGLPSIVDSTLGGEGLDSVPHSVPIILPDTVDAQKVGSELKPLLGPHL